MFSDVKDKLLVMKDLQYRRDEIDLAYANDITEIEELMANVRLDDKILRQYNIGLYAIENYRKCNKMSVEEAYLYVDNLFKIEEELENAKCK